MTTGKIKSTSRDSGKWLGFCLLFAAGMILAQRSGVPFPVKVIFSWQIFLIIFGFFDGIRRRFRGVGWLVMMLVGGFFFVDGFYPSMSLHQFILPAMFAIVGLVFIFRPRCKTSRNNIDTEDWKQTKQADEQLYGNAATSGEEYLDLTTILSGTKKSIVSKNFKGGEAISFLGGTELNLSQADINGKVRLELTQVFGGVKLTVPPHWDIKTEIVSIFGGVDDKRPLVAGAVDPNKVLVLVGTSVFAGIEINSY